MGQPEITLNEGQVHVGMLVTSVFRQRDEESEGVVCIDGSPGQRSFVPWPEDSSAKKFTSKQGLIDHVWEHRFHPIHACWVREAPPSTSFVVLVDGGLLYKNSPRRLYVATDADGNLWDATDLTKWAELDRTFSQDTILIPFVKIGSTESRAPVAAV